VVETLRGLAASLPLFDLVFNSAQFLTIAADQLLTPMILFSFTILPNVETPPNLAWLEQAFVFAVVVLGGVVLLDAVLNTIQKWRQTDAST